MLEVDQSNFHEWEHVHADGILRYVSRHGILEWGLSGFLAWNGTQYLDDGVLPSDIAFVAGCAVIMAIGGMLFGCVFWWRNERRYWKYVAEVEIASTLPPDGIGETLAAIGGEGPG